MNAYDPDRDRLQERLQKLQQAASKGQRWYTVRCMLLFGAILMTTWALLLALVHWKFGARFDRVFIFSMPSVVFPAIVIPLSLWPHLQRQIKQLQDQLSRLR